MGSPSVKSVSVLLALTLVAAACGTSSTTGTPQTGALQEVQGTATRPLALTSPEATPPVDRSMASVELDQIIFDTFGRGPSFSLATGQEDSIRGLFDAIAPIDAPDYETAESASWLKPEDIVVGYVDPEGGSWAYPARILNKHEIVNDELGGSPILISFCPLCGSGVVYERTLGGRELSFSNTSALFENDLVMVDRETGSYWWQVAGAAIVGELNGQSLVPLASQTTTWSAWEEAHPETAVLARLAGRDYSRDSFANYGERLDQGQTPFPVSEAAMADDRLAASSRVLVATINGETKAWATDPARVVEESFGDEQVTVTLDGTGGRVTDAHGNDLPVRSAFWFSAVSAFPNIELGE